MWILLPDFRQGFKSAMLLNEWNWDDALAVSREEGWGERDIVIARNALAEGLPLELIHDITGLDIETITRLQPGV